LICLALVGLILVQRGKGGGLAAFGGGGGVEQAFGTHAATLAQKATTVLAILFLVVTIVLAKMYRPASAVKAEPGVAAPAEKQPAAEEPAVPASAPDGEKE